MVLNIEHATMGSKIIPGNAMSCFLTTGAAFCPYPGDHLITSIHLASNGMFLISLLHFETNVMSPLTDDSERP